ncbi:hypothetical protein BpHYR1_029773 [Brachionus plicatilis]|uniref:Uncharacterized protein n=1 Tax=Brachionus plicatilis TaxID=10195 RepID=A0A3M7T986_BRAPC|nr:hypothetical protein BpHYR1_029773 [Brachionus plicatilis]
MDGQDRLKDRKNLENSNIHYFLIPYPLFRTLFDLRINFGYIMFWFTFLNIQINVLLPTVYLILSDCNYTRSDTIIIFSLIRISLSFKKAIFAAFQVGKRKA